jgi:hypothetical protein
MVDPHRNRRLWHSSSEAIGYFTYRGRLTTQGILDEPVRHELDFLGVAIGSLLRGKQRSAK